MTYDVFKQKIASVLTDADKPLTWTEIRTAARLPQLFPNNQWVHPRRQHPWPFNGAVLRLPVKLRRLVRADAKEFGDRGMARALRQYKRSHPEAQEPSNFAW
jgi:hypothetical protein